MLQLNGANYQRWKYEILATLEFKGVLDVVNGTEAKPAATDAAGLKDWKKKDAQARSIISKSLDDTHHSYIRDCPSSKEIWDKIKSMKEASSISGQLFANQAFHAFKWEPGMSVGSFISSLNVVVENLRSQGGQLETPTILGKVIQCLPKEFDSFRQSWRLMASKDSTLAQLQQQLLAVEDDMRSRGLDLTPNPAGEAFLGQKPSGQRPRNNNRNQGPRNDNRSQGPRETRTCNHCKKKGHIMKDCWTLHGKPDGQGNPAQSRGGNQANPAQGPGGKSYMALSDLRSQEHDGWVGDSGAYQHITGNKEWFSELTPLQDPESITVADGNKVYATAVGVIEVEGFDGKKWTPNRLTNVRYVRDFGEANLFSIGAVASKGFEVTIKGETIEFKDEGKTTLVGYKEGNLYNLLLRCKKPRFACGAQAEAKDMETWHQRLGHISVDKIKTMISKDLVSGLKVKETPKFFCEGCVYGSMTRTPHKEIKERRDAKPGQYIHMDLCGPFNEPSLGGSKYFVCFKCECTGFRRVLFMKTKDETLPRFKTFLAEVENETRNKVVCIRSDNGTEFVNKEFDAFLNKRGILRETTPTYTPEANGMAERENRTLLDKARSMIHSKGLQTRLWAEAVATAAQIMNLVPNRKETEKTPHELWYGKKPDVSHLRVFGCPAYAHVPREKRRKMDPKARKGILVGYTKSAKIYRVFFYDRQQVEEVCDVKFDETLPKLIVLDDDPVEDGNPDEPRRDEGALDLFQLEEETPPGNETPVKRIGRPPGIKNKPKPTPLPHGMERRSNRVLLALTADPASVEDALSREDKKEWKEAMTKEMNSLEKNGTWTLTKLPPGRKTVQNKWVFKTKRNPNGSLDKYKARLVAKGFSQRKGVDFGETFAPVVRYDSIRTLLAVAAEEDLEMMQFDVTTAFLHGDLKEEIFMEQPEGFEDGSERVCLLKKGLYGLKQAPRAWNEKIDTFFKGIGLTRSEADHSIYFGPDKNGELVMIALYVDDGLLFCRSGNTLREIVKELRTRFDITTGDPEKTSAYFVGLEITRKRGEKKILLNQRGYLERILEKFNMTDCKAVSSPGDPSNKLSKEMEPKTETEKDQMKAVPYREAVGSLMFAMTCTRPDIAFEVGKVAQYCENPGPDHWTAVKRILRYIKGTLDLSIVYGGTRPRTGLTPKESTPNGLTLECFCDSDHAGDLDKRRSTAGVILLLNNGPVAWMSRLQKTIAQSTTEAEYMAIAEGVKEVKWFRQLLEDIGRAQEGSTPLWTDNQGAMALTKNPEYHRRTKHIDVRYHFIRDEQETGTVTVGFVPTDEQPADMLTKSLSGPGLINCRKMSNMQ